MCSRFSRESRQISQSVLPLPSAKLCIQWTRDELFLHNDDFIARFRNISPDVPSLERRLAILEQIRELDADGDGYVSVQVKHKAAVSAFVCDFMTGGLCPSSSCL